MQALLRAALARLQLQSAANLQRGRALVHGVEVQGGHPGAAQLVAQISHHVQAKRLDAGGIVAKRLQAELAEAVRGRLTKPLQPLVPDQIIALEQPPLRSILFTYVGTTDRPGYEYRLVCRNDGPERFLSAVRILLFSETGIQIGAAEVSDSADWSRLGATGLAPGESAAFSGRVALQFGDQPRYFLVLTLAAEGRLPRLSP